MTPQRNPHERSDIRAPDIAALIQATFAGTACRSATLSFSESGWGTRRTNMLKCLLAVTALVVSGGLSLAQTQQMQGPPSAQHLDYPVRPVRMVVPYAPGGVTDVVARLIAQQLSQRLDRQFYIE